ncbi:hypothetical protein [Lacrimispora algidixylanolytica]|uniref:Antigen I/II N-terminal domain-containing protein n=1 Tax=Lacrimispora algidixylanolytica TaxID=94868 RepID=A0A419T2W0_9FIRM|nr:hypothetical protein [Lacrimispora algidixylanolytica]RKD31857.1 hypothetical protein BET01_18985 [Lacrimispora algidixylanolytica]
MKKSKLFTTAILILTTILVAGCSKKTGTVSTTSETTISESSIEGSEDETKDNLEAMGGVEVEKGLFNVELTIPAQFVGEQTQEELNELSKEKGYKSITLNEDGSAKYILTKQQHKDMMAELNTNINTSLSEMIGSEDYPNYTDITANENYTEFVITTKSTELSMTENFSALGLYMYGGMYNIFNGTPVDNVSVKFINTDTGAEITTMNSKNMGQ